MPEASRPRPGLFDNVGVAGRYFEPRYGRPYWSRYGGGVSTNPEHHPTSFMINGLLRILKEKGVPPAGKAVELGCGQGQVSVILAKLGYYVDAIDDSPQAVNDTLRLAAVHDEEIRASRGGVSGLHCDVRRYPFFLKPYDLLSSQGVIHYIPEDDTKLLISRMQAATAVGGLNAITTWIDQPKPMVPSHSEVTLYPDERDTVISMYSPSRGWNPLMIVYDLNKLDVSHPEGEEQEHRHSYIKIIAEKVSEIESIVPWNGSQKLVPLTGKTQL